ncbi:hypothetical protein BCR44DRAFT_1440494 [Catenaria anguillulae PL171]|uniref:BRCT domain-containing protein n=1 Tax=Catenaria anguillulae PL171 TaxID=765915 RepID=A0A1Y2HEH7_9FUNG|nr:hypothetical protein BCR44DRAFT_1440494 [Catenaria anguillulae PL171]
MEPHWVFGRPPPSQAQAEAALPDCHELPSHSHSQITAVPGSTQDSADSLLAGNTHVLVAAAAVCKSPHFLHLIGAHVPPPTQRDASGGVGTGASVDGLGNQDGDNADLTCSATLSGTGTRANSASASTNTRLGDGPIIHDLSPHSTFLIPPLPSVHSSVPVPGTAPANSASMPPSSPPMDVSQPFPPSLPDTIPLQNNPMAFRPPAALDPTFLLGDPTQHIPPPTAALGPTPRRGGPLPPAGQAVPIGAVRPQLLHDSSQSSSSSEPSSRSGYQRHLDDTQELPAVTAPHSDIHDQLTQPILSNANVFDLSTQPLSPTPKLPAALHSDLADTLEMPHLPPPRVASRLPAPHATTHHPLGNGRQVITDLTGDIIFASASQLDMHEAPTQVLPSTQTPSQQDQATAAQPPRRKPCQSLVAQPPRAPMPRGGASATPATDRRRGAEKVSADMRLEQDLDETQPLPNLEMHDAATQPLPTARVQPQQQRHWPPPQHVRPCHGPAGSDAEHVMARVRKLSLDAAEEEEEDPIIMTPPHPAPPAMAERGRPRHGQQTGRQNQRQIVVDTPDKVVPATPSFIHDQRALTAAARVPSPMLNCSAGTTSTATLSDGSAPPATDSHPANVHEDDTIDLAVYRRPQRTDPSDTHDPDDSITSHAHTYFNDTNQSSIAFPGYTPADQFGVVAARAAGREFPKPSQLPNAVTVRERDLDLIGPGPSGFQAQAAATASVPVKPKKKVVELVTLSSGTAFDPGPRQNAKPDVEMGEAAPADSSYLDGKELESISSESSRRASLVVADSSLTTLDLSNSIGNESIDLEQSQPMSHRSTSLSTTVSSALGFLHHPAPPHLPQRLPAAQPIQHLQQSRPRRPQPAPAPPHPHDLSTDLSDLSLASMLGQPPLTQPPLTKPPANTSQPGVLLDSPETMLSLELAGNEESPGQILAADPAIEQQPVGRRTRQAALRTKDPLVRVSQEDQGSTDSENDGVLGLLGMPVTESARGAHAPLPPPPSGGVATRARQRIMQLAAGHGIQLSPITEVVSPQTTMPSPAVSAVGGRENLAPLRLPAPESRDVEMLDVRRPESPLSDLDMTQAPTPPAPAASTSQSRTRSARHRRYGPADVADDEGSDMDQDDPAPQAPERDPFAFSGGSSVQSKRVVHEESEDQDAHGDSDTEDELIGAMPQPASRAHGKRVHPMTPPMANKRKRGAAGSGDEVSATARKRARTESEGMVPRQIEILVPPRPGTARWGRGKGSKALGRGKAQPIEAKALPTRLLPGRKSRPDVIRGVSSSSSEGEEDVSKDPSYETQSVIVVQERIGVQMLHREDEDDEEPEDDHMDVDQPSVPASKAAGRVGKGGASHVTRSMTASRRQKRGGRANGIVADSTSPPPIPDLYKVTSLVWVLAPTNSDSGAHVRHVSHPVGPDQLVPAFFVPHSHLRPYVPLPPGHHFMYMGRRVKVTESAAADEFDSYSVVHVGGGDSSEIPMMAEMDSHRPTAASAPPVTPDPVVDGPEPSASDYFETPMHTSPLRSEPDTPILHPPPPPLPPATSLTTRAAPMPPRMDRADTIELPQTPPRSSLLPQGVGPLVAKYSTLSPTHVPAVKGRKLFSGLKFALTLIHPTDVDRELPKDDELPPVSPADADPSFSTDNIKSLIVSNGGAIIDKLDTVAPITDMHSAKVFCISTLPRRSEKYLMALALGIPRVSCAWIIDCVGEDKLLPPAYYLLSNGFSHELRAQAPSMSVRAIFRGLAFHLGQQHDSWKPVIVAAGGSIVTNRRNADYSLVATKSKVKSSPVPTIRPEFIVQCLINQRLLDWSKKAVYHA